MKTRTRTETPEQRLERWMADPDRKTISLERLRELGWEAGQRGYIECYGMRYEMFDIDNESFCVVEWDEEGDSISVA